MTSEKYLIQSLMWRQCVSEDVFKQMVAKCLKVDSRQPEGQTGAEVSDELVAQMVSKVNRNIRPFQMAISRGPNETEGTVYYALINTADNEITRMSNQWSNKEILYFRKLMQKMIETENSFISSTKALNIGREEDLKFSITICENLINKWVEQKWFEEIGDGSVAIGVRTLLEMNVYIREHFEVQDCFRCKALCIRGTNCMSCDTKLHFHCIDSQFIPNNKCPNCGKQFESNPQSFGTASSRNSNDVHTLEEEADTEEDEEPIQRTKRAKRSKR